MRYLAVLGRQPEISIAEFEAQGFSIVENGSCPNSFFSGAAPKALAQVLGPSKKELRPPVSKSIAPPVDIKRFGGVLKLAIELEQKPLEYLQSLSEGKITIGVSDYSKNASRRTASSEALKLKKILVRHGRSVRVVENKEAVLSTATSLHNGLGGKNERKVEFIKVNDEWFRVIGVQDIEAYAKRDQARPARDAKVGMLPPKLAQVLINLCGPLAPGSVVLDPFCGTGVVLQESLLMGYRAYGTDINERMVSYSKKNLDYFKFKDYEVEVGDATSFEWKKPINAVACEGYLGRPFSKAPSEMNLKKEKQECTTIILGFLKNLSTQISEGTPVTLAAPAWLRENGSYERLDIIDEIIKLGYNVSNKTQKGLFYYREGQIVARDIIILRKN